MSIERKVFLSWFFLIVAMVAVGAIGAVLLAFFDIDSEAYAWGFAILAVATMIYKRYNQ